MPGVQVGGQLLRIVEEAFGRPGRALGRRPGAVDGGVDAVAGQEPGQAGQRGHGAGERDGRGPGFRAGPRVERDVGPPREVIVRAVRDRHQERPVALARELVGEPDDLGAFAGLAHDDRERSAVQHRAAEVQELGRVHEQGGHPPRREVVDRRVARVVGAPHAREYDRPSGGARLPDPFERVALVDQGGRRAPHRVGLAGDLAQERVGEALQGSHAASLVPIRPLPRERARA